MSTSSHLPTVVVALMTIGSALTAIGFGVIRYSLYAE